MYAEEPLPFPAGFQAGQRVIVEGLQSTSGRRHNGCLGIILAQTLESIEKERLVVWLLGLGQREKGGIRTLLVKSKHVHPLGSESSRAALLRARIITELQLERIFRSRLGESAAADIIGEIGRHIPTPHEIFMFSGFRGKVFDDVLALPRSSLYLPRAHDDNHGEGQRPGAPPNWRRMGGMEPRIDAASWSLGLGMFCCAGGVDDHPHRGQATAHPTV